MGVPLDFRGGPMDGDVVVVYVWRGRMASVAGVPADDGLVGDAAQDRAGYPYPPSELHGMPAMNLPKSLPLSISNGADEHNQQVLAEARGSVPQVLGGDIEHGELSPVGSRSSCAPVGGRRKSRRGLMV